MAVQVVYLDDDELLCKIFYDSFHRDGVNVRTFLNADEAIEAVSTNPPDIFFIDFRLKGTNGDKVAQSVSKDIPKVLVTGDLSAEPEGEFVAIVSKPYDLDEVQSIINAFS